MLDGGLLGFDLTNHAAEEQSLSVMAWTLILYLAERYGWEPERTLPPAGVEVTQWRGNYDSNEGQSMGPGDAAAFADALNRATQDPEREMAIREVAAELSSKLQTATGRPFALEVNESYWPAIAALVPFCRRGPVRIE